MTTATETPIKLVSNTLRVVFANVGRYGTLVVDDCIGSVTVEAPYETDEDVLTEWAESREKSLVDEYISVRMGGSLTWLVDDCEGEEDEICTFTLVARYTYHGPYCD